MVVQARLVTADDLWKLSHLPTRTARLELVEGAICEMTPTGGLHGVLASELNYHLLHYAKAHHLGLVTSAETGFTLFTNPDTVRAPDVGFISETRLPSPIPPKYFLFAPDLAVEVVSPGDSAQEIRKKVIEYLRAGTVLVWVVYPDSRTVDVYHAQSVAVLDLDNELSGGDVLPGFRLPLRVLFESIDR